MELKSGTLLSANNGSIQEVAEHDSASGVAVKKVGLYVWDPISLTFVKVTGDSDGVINTTISGNFILALDYDVDGNLIYLGKAAPGSTKSEAVWQIKKNTYSSGNLVDVQLADGNDSFDNIWNNRASLSYS